MSNDYHRPIEFRMASDSPREILRVSPCGEVYLHGELVTTDEQRIAVYWELVEHLGAGLSGAGEWREEQ